MSIDNWIPQCAHSDWHMQHHATWSLSPNLKLCNQHYNVTYFDHHATKTWSYKYITYTQVSNHDTPQTMVHHHQPLSFRARTPPTSSGQSQGPWAPLPSVPSSQHKRRRCPRNPGIAPSAEPAVDFSKVFSNACIKCSWGYGSLKMIPNSWMD